MTPFQNSSAINHSALNGIQVMSVFKAMRTFKFDNNSEHILVRVTHCRHVDLAVVFRFVRRKVAMFHKLYST